MELTTQPKNDTSKSLVLSKSTSSDVIEVLMLCNLADSRFAYSETQLNYWAKELQADYPDFNIEDFVKVIRKGVKGGYETKSNHITLSVIYKWVADETKNYSHVFKIDKYWHIICRAGDGTLFYPDPIAESKYDEFKQKLLSRYDKPTIVSEDLKDKAWR